MGTCPNGAQACVPSDSGPSCGEGCYCGTCAEGVTVWFKSGGLCIGFLSGSCQTGQECPTFRTSGDCAIGQPCIDITGCCDDIGNRTVPLPAGTKNLR